MNDSFIKDLKSLNVISYFPLCPLGTYCCTIRRWDISWRKNFTQSVRVELPKELVTDLNIPEEEVFAVSL